MPAVVCHWLLGKRLEEAAREATGENFRENSFYTGCQGPDVLFYHRLVSFSRKNSLMKYGSTVHRNRPSPLFAVFKKTVDQGGGLYPNMLSYALGLCCHYAYDRWAHPYICRLEERMKLCDDRGADYHYHAHIESALDVIMMRYETGGLISDVRLGRCVRFDKNDRDAAAVLWGSAMSELYGTDPGEKELRLLLPHMRRLFRLLDDPTAVWRPIVAKLEHLAGMDDAPMSAYMRPFMEDDEYDYANIAKEEWRSAADPETVSCEDFFELTDKAEQYARDFMRFFMSAESESDFAGYTGDASF